MNQSNAQSYSWRNRMIGNGDTIRTYNVLFDLAKWDITEHSYLFLDSLSTFLKQNEEVTIVVTNHDDIEASEERSFFVTQARAESIKEYLVKSGINPERISAVGYEDDYLIYDRQFINQLSTVEQKEKARAFNRRTEIIITQPNKK